MPDRASGDLRFFTLLTILAKQHHVTFCDCGSARTQAAELGETTLSAYKDGLESIGVHVSGKGVVAALKTSQFDIVFFEFYYSASRFIDDVRYWQPSARIVVDSVDVHFVRFAARARLSGTTEDREHAQLVKTEELHCYKHADVVIAVTADDKQALLREEPKLEVAVIPNIHPLFPLNPKSGRDPRKLIFVGGFTHEPNVDAVLFFCRDVLPLILEKEPATQLLVVGNAPPPEIKSLACENVKILGFVPDTAPYLQSAYISVAPLRYGGGMKGKVGEAMAHGLPVVTTSFGAEGFGFVHGEVLVGNAPEEFAAHVVALQRDSLLYQKTSEAGWTFIRDNYSAEAVSQQIHKVIESIANQRLQRLSPWRRLKKFFSIQLEERVLWRIRGNQT